MSTIFAIMNKGYIARTNGDGILINDPFEYTEVAVKSGNGMSFISPFDKIYHVFNTDLRVYPINYSTDNSHEVGSVSIGTIKELLHSKQYPLGFSDLFVD